MKLNILLIYTGGTIGMMKDPATGALRSFNFNELLVHIPEVRQLDCDIHPISYEHPIDSSNMNLKHWRELGDIIHKNYDDYDGFVVLHGSDTMSYTGSVLSFMFENLTKPII
ncbi:MAG: asparaginase, partial [Nonlabens sp.]|nr:asparaginase [Nonlabens sp.]